MGRISFEATVSAMRKVGAMSREEKESLADEIHLRQPHMLGSFLVQHQLGVSVAKMEFLLNILLVCFQAMKESPIDWPLITEEEQDRQMARYTAGVKFAEDLGGALRGQALDDYVLSHPERELLAFVYGEINRWLTQIEPEESDKYVMLAAMSYVNCIAHVPLTEPNNALNTDGLGQRAFGASPTPAG